MKSLIVTFIILGCISIAQAKTLCRYRVSLRDKAATEYSLNNPEAYLSEKALQRRIKQGLKIDSTDLPVCRIYKKQIAACGVKIVGGSKWNNTVLVESSDTTKINQIKQLPFVYGVSKVWISPENPPREDEDKIEITDEYTASKEYYGAAQQQVTMLNVDKLHALGFKGSTMEIAVIDGGYMCANKVKLMRDIKIQGTHNFVKDENVYVHGKCKHGTKVLSCMAANEPYVIVGTAPEASYWLLCSEDNKTEYPVEEDYWAGAVEYADSVGVDIINTSLGYSSFDDESMNYSYAQLDGHSSLASVTATMAADKGILLVCSAGNEGSKRWKKITVPADANYVLTVGAVDDRGVNTIFSSVGNTADGRIKPDVMAIGDGTAIINADGTIGEANGTSFAAPTMCGAVACLWQACPHLTAKELIRVVQMSGDRATHPDNIYGYGVPDFLKAYQLGCEVEARINSEVDNIIMK